jgi:hypothetical protein
MAKVKTLDKHGSVGPSTFMTTAHGVVERARTWQIDPKTPRQRNYRQFVKVVWGQWRELSEEARAGWNALAGQWRGHASGANLHFKINVTLANCGLPMRTEAPPVPVLGKLTCAGLLVDDTPQVKLLQLGSTAAAERWVLESCAPVHAGIQNVKNRLAQFAVLPGPAGKTVDLDVTKAFLARFKTLRAGQRVCIQLCVMSNGFKSDPIQVSTIVAKRGA